MKMPTAIMIVGDVAITGDPGSVAREAMRQVALQECRKDAEDIVDELVPGQVGDVRRRGGRLQCFDERGHWVDVEADR